MLKLEDLELLEQLGKGGFSTVYRCRNKYTKECYALKRIPKERLVSEKEKARLVVEQHILASIRHPFLCRSIQPFQEAEDADHISLLLEFIDGKPLYQCIWCYQPTNGYFPETMVKFYAAQLVLAVRALHDNGYIHGDLKSGNVLIDRKHGFIKVIDFGFARKIDTKGDEAKDPSTQPFCGTHYVMAPELLARQPYGFEVDWWSVGVIIYEMAFGRPPWKYKCPPTSSLDKYFETIKHYAINVDGFPPEPVTSVELRSFIRDLLQIQPTKRLGHDGAVQVMQHPWLDGIDWECVECVEPDRNGIVAPLHLDVDCNFAVLSHRPVVDIDEELSSAESIDPEDDAKYFADF